MNRSIFNVLFGTFTLRFSTALTGGLLAYYLGNLENHGGAEVTAFAFAIVHAAFYATELIVSPIFGLLSDRLGHHRVMQFGPIFGAVAVTITALTTNLVILGGTRVLEGAATAASIPSILGFLALATSANEDLRGKVSARFELATLAGLGAGIGAAGIFWELFHTAAFFVNAAFYMFSFAIYRFGVKAPDAPAGPHHRPEYGWRRYGNLVRTSHIWLLAPTWIALNAAIGVYSGTGLFNLVRDESDRFPNQILAGGLSTLEITDRPDRHRDRVRGRPDLLGQPLQVDAPDDDHLLRHHRRCCAGCLGLLFNHSGGIEPVFRLPLAITAGAALFVLAGATPAALGLLADMSEAYPDDRGAVMGLYGVFLALGQIVGTLVGGWAADKAGFDGLLLATLLFIVIAMVPLYWLRRYEHEFTAGPKPIPAES